MPGKARIKGVAQFSKVMGIPYYKTDLFKYYGVSRKQDMRYLLSQTRITTEDTIIILLSQKGVAGLVNSHLSNLQV